MESEKAGHQHTAEEERRIREAALDRRSPTRFRRVILLHQIPIPTIIQPLSVSVQLMPIQNVRTRRVGNRLVTQTCEPFRRITALLPSLSQSTELATAIQRIQSETFSDVVPNAFWRKGT
jgi:hypothetical protein